MYCEKCKVSVKSDFPICPLCHATLVADEVLNASVTTDGTQGKTTALPTIEYPKRIKRVKTMDNIPITSVFLLVFLPLFIMSLVLDIVMFTNPTWSLIIGAVIFISYVTARNTFLSDCGYGMRIAYQLLGFILLSYSIQTLVTDVEFASSIALPALITIALTVNSIFLIIKHSYNASLYVSSILFSLLSLLPLILALCNVMYASVMVIVTAVVGVIALIVTIAFGRRKLWSIFKMTFNN